VAVADGLVVQVWGAGTPERCGVEAECCAPVLLEHGDRHRQGAVGGAVGRIVSDVDERGGAVVGHDRGDRVAAGVEVGGADVGGDRLGVAGPEVEEVAEEHVRAGTDQQAGWLSHEVEVEADGGARAVHGVPHVERRQDVEARQVRDRVGVVEAGAEGDEGAAVVPGQREALVAERTGERDDVRGHRALGVGGTGRVRGLVAGAVAAQVGTEHGVVIRQVRCDVPPLTRALLRALWLLGRRSAPLSLVRAEASLRRWAAWWRLRLGVVKRRVKGTSFGGRSEDAHTSPLPGDRSRAVVAASGLDGVPEDALVVFVSYAREDEEWRRKFEIVLKPLAHEGLVVWSDERIAVGQMWRAELERAIARADAALVLVSPDLLVSEFVMNEELPALRARGIPLGLVHVRESVAGRVPAFADVQWAHDPARSLAGLPDPDGEIMRICGWLESLLPDRALPDELEWTDGGRERSDRRVPRLARSARMGDLHGVPPPTTGEIERVELAGLRDALLGESQGTVGITGRGRAVGLHGQGGIGKTVLAAALARDRQVRRHFPDGVYWVTVGESGDIVGLQLALLELLGAPRPQLRSREVAAGALRKALDELRCLLVVDDVWTAPAAAAFDVTGTLGRVLYTTRDERVLRSVSAHVQHVGVLSDDVARLLLAELTDQLVDALPLAATDRVLDATGRIALAVSLIGAAVGLGGRDWDEVADELDDADTTFRDHPYADVFKAMQIGVSALDDQLEGVYRTLAVYPQDERVQVSAIARLWCHIEAAGTLEQTRSLLERLAGRELLTLDGDAISFHDLQHEFLLLRAGDMRLAHDELLAAYRALLPADDQHWHRLPRSEPYIWTHLLRHLRGASNPAGVHAVVTDLVYLAARCARDGPYTVESDLRTAARLYPGDAAIEWTLDIFSRWSHLLGGHATPGDVATALAIRARNPPTSLDVGALRVLTSAPLLTPLWGLPDAPDALLRTFEGHSERVNAVAFSPDGTLASAGDDGVLRLWDPANGQLTRTFGGYYETVAFSPDGRTLAAAGGGGVVWLLDPADGRAIRNFWSPGSFDFDNIGFECGVRAVAFSPDGRTLANASDMALVSLWEVTSGRNPCVLGGSINLSRPSKGRGVSAIAFSPDGKTLVSAHDNGDMLWWDDIEWGDIEIWPFRAVKSHRGGTQAVTFSRDAQTLASAGDDGAVRLWNPANGQLTRTLERHDGPVRAVAFSPDGRTLASAGDDGAVRLWNPANGELTQSFKARSTRVRAVAFSPDGRTLASAGDDGAVRLWDPANGHLINTGESESSELHTVAFSPQGNMLASAGDDGALRLWDLASGHLIHTPESHSSRVRVVAFSPDGRTLVSAADDSSVRFWNLANGEPTQSFTGHSGALLAAAFSLDGRRLASASDEGTMRFWENRRGRWAPLRRGVLRRPMYALEGSREDRTWSAATFSRDGRTLASASGDKVTLWDVARRTPLYQARTGFDITALAWSVERVALAMDGAVTVFAMSESRPDGTDH
jgi:WD40 repeat protein